MGFTPEPTIYTLNFKDTELDGLIIKATCTSIDEFHGMLRQGRADNGEESAANSEAQLRKLIDHVKSWNLDGPDGDTAPISYDSIRTMEYRHINMIMAAWQKALVDVPAPLKEPSMNGRLSEEESLGLAGSSRSL